MLLLLNSRPNRLIWRVLNSDNSFIHRSLSLSLSLSLGPLFMQLSPNPS
jgi:hypothetical protein